MSAPYRLVSLREMLQLPIGKMLAAVQRLSSFHQSICESAVGHAKGVPVQFDREHLQPVVLAATELSETAGAIGLNVTQMLANELAAEFRAVTESSPPNVMLFIPDRVDRIYTKLNTITECLWAESATKVAFMLGPDKLHLFEPTAPLFGPAFQTGFSGLMYEIDEGAKCLALGRSTAAAFHFIRCMEGGITALSRCLGIPDPTKGSDRSWMKLLDALDKAIKLKWPKSSDRFTGDGRFFEEAHATLAAIQNPYRNSTMHLDQKYTEEEARHIMEMVKGFMRKIASRMDENGDPKA